MNVLRHYFDLLLQDLGSHPPAHVRLGLRLLVNHDSNNDDDDADDDDDEAVDQVRVRAQGELHHRGGKDERSL